MHRQPLLALLRRYREMYPDEGPVIDRFERFVTDYPACLLRSCIPGHVTASAWITSSDHQRFLLTRHRKLGRWLQLGGHVDGDPLVHEAALREAREESGMARFELVLREEEVVPLDLDVHVIPARGDEPKHLHYDIRFLLVSAPGQNPERSVESLELRWFTYAELGTIAYEESLHRLAGKAGAWLDGE